MLLIPPAAVAPSPAFILTATATVVLTLRWCDTMVEETITKLWRACKEGNAESLPEIIASCKSQNVDLSVGNSERFGATAMHYGTTEPVSQRLDRLV